MFVFRYMYLKRGIQTHPFSENVGGFKQPRAIFAVPCLDSSWMRYCDILGRHCKLK